jgi:hypothetical protein
MFDYWKNQYTDRGFTPGGMYCKDNLCYIPIPKNSSCYTVDLLTRNGWTASNFLTADLTDKKFVVLLRDPIDRWITGIAQYFCSVVVDNEYATEEIERDFNELVKRIIFDQVIFDDHTETQLYFIKSIPLAQCTFFDSSTDLAETLKKYLVSENQNLNTEYELFRNASNDNIVHPNLVKLFKNWVETDKNLVDRLTYVYADDFELIKKLRY